MQAASLHASTAETASAVCEVLTFDLGAERYAIFLGDVQEIRGYEAPTKLPAAAPYALGVINLRGDAVPLLDLRLLLGCAKSEVTATTAIVIVKAQGRIAGLVVDSVCDVLELAEGQLKPAPRMSGTSHANILGLASVRDQLVIALDARPYLELAAAMV